MSATRLNNRGDVFWRIAAGVLIVVMTALLIGQSTERLTFLRNPKTGPILLVTVFAIVASGTFFGMPKRRSDQPTDLGDANAVSINTPTHDRSHSENIRTWVHVASLGIMLLAMFAFGIEVQDFPERVVLRWNEIPAILIVFVLAELGGELIATAAAVKADVSSAAREAAAAVAAASLVLAQLNTEAESFRSATAVFANASLNWEQAHGELRQTTESLLHSSDLIRAVEGFRRYANVKAKVVWDILTMFVDSWKPDGADGSHSVVGLLFKHFVEGRGPQDGTVRTTDDTVTVMLTNMIGAEIKLVGDGYHIGPADDGYVSKRIYVEGKKKFAQFPDPERAQFYRLMFSMRADGGHSDEEIVKHINGVGYASRARNRWDKHHTRVIGRHSGRPLTVKKLQQIILRSVYCGVLVKKWTHDLPVRARGGEALVSIDTYNRANRGKRMIVEHNDNKLVMLYDQHLERSSRKRHKFSERWRFKNVVVCPYCRSPLWASASRSRSGKYFTFYHCSRGHKRYAIPQRTLEPALEAFLLTVRFTERAWDTLTVTLRSEFQKVVGVAQGLERSSAQAVRTLEERKAQLVDAFALATSDSVRTSLESKVQALDADMAAMRATRRDLDLGKTDVDIFLGYARRFLEHPVRILISAANLAEQVALYKLFFQESPTYEEIVFGTPELTATFRVFQPIESSENQVVRRAGFEPA